MDKNLMMIILVIVCCCVCAIAAAWYFMSDDETPGSSSSSVVTTPAFSSTVVTPPASSSTVVTTPAFSSTVAAEWKVANRDFYIANKATGSASGTFWVSGSQTLQACKEDCAVNNGLTGGNPEIVGCTFIKFKPEEPETKCWFSNSLTESGIQAAKSMSQTELGTYDPTSGYGYVNTTAKQIRNYIPNELTQ